MFRRKRSANDFAEEIKAHLELEASELRREGLAEDEAQRRARIHFGNVTAAQERFYLRDRVEWLDNIMRDMQFALRQFAKRPSFACTAVTVLALGIGVSVAIFGFVDAALLRPLPYPNPNRLLSVNESGVEAARWPLSYPDFLDWRDSNKSFSSLDVYSPTGFLLRTPAGAEPVLAERVSQNFFETLGVRPSLGRDFAPGEDKLNGPNLVILSYSAWDRRFNARRDIVGQPIQLSGAQYTVVGVLPRSFSFAPGGSAEFWVPINKLSAHENFRNFYNFFGLGRLRDGVTLQAAQAEMRAISKRLQHQFPTGREHGVNIVPLSEIVIGDIRPILLTLLGGAGLLLLIACVNVTSLVLARSESRRREFAVRVALGGTPKRLMLQFVTEGLLLASLGSAAGILLAAVIMQLLGRLIPKDVAANMPFLERVGVNAHTVSFAASLAFFALLLLAATPHLRLVFEKVREGVIDGDRTTGSRAWHHFGSNLVVAELAIAVVLLVSAGLLGQSLYRLLHVPLGLEPEHVATLQVTAPDTLYKNDAQMEALYNEILRRTTALPGVESAGLTSVLPVQCNCALDSIRVVGKPAVDDHTEVNERHISPGYFASLHATLARGHDLTAADDASHPGVVVINQSLAHRYFGTQNPLGESISNEEAGRPSTWRIVGVVDDIHEGPLDAATAPAEYFPLDQTHDRSFTLTVRTQQSAAAILPVLVENLHQINPELGTSDEGTLTAKIGATQAALLHRFSAFLIGGFALVALLLAVVGLYGVIAYSVNQRTREIGVRMAIGAQRTTVYKLVLQQAGWLTLVGLVIGLLSSVGASVLMRKLLFGVQAWDPETLAGVALVLAAASLAASFMPAHRAASIDPIKALRTN